MLKIVSQIQSKTICKYCYSWQNMGLVFRTSKKNWKQDMDNLHGRKPVVAKKKNKEGSLLHIFLMWCCSLPVTSFLVSRCYNKKA